MIEVVTSRNAILYRDALDDMYRLRHRVLVERFGLENLRRADGRQKDRFDTDDAIYLLLTDDEGALHGAMRLLPTLGAHVFSDVFPDLCAVAGVQRGPGMLEMTRAVVDESGQGGAAVAAAHKHLVVGLFEFCLRAGYDKFTMLLPTDMLFHHLLMGIDIRPLGLTTERDGIRQVAVAVTADQAALDALRYALDVDDPLVHYVGGPMADSLVLSPAQPARLAAAG
jgi:acyl-homoserine lactone synthase